MGWTGLRDGTGIKFPMWCEDWLWRKRKGAISLSLMLCLSHCWGQFCQTGRRRERERRCAEHVLSDMDRWMLPVGLAAWAAELCWGIRGGKRLNWRFIYPIHCQGQLVGELARVFTKCQNLDALFWNWKRGGSMTFGCIALQAAGTS